MDVVCDPLRGPANGKYIYKGGKFASECSNGKAQQEVQKLNCKYFLSYT